MTFYKFLKKHNINNVCPFDLVNFELGLNDKPYYGLFSKKDLEYIYDNITKNPKDYLFLINKNDDYYFKKLPSKIKYNRVILKKAMKYALILDIIPLRYLKKNIDLIWLNLKDNKFLISKLLSFKNREFILNKIANSFKDNFELVYELHDKKIYLSNFTNNKSIIAYVKAIEEMRKINASNAYLYWNLKSYFDNEQVSLLQEENIKLIKKILKIAPYLIFLFDFNKYQNEKRFLIDVSKIINDSKNKALINVLFNASNSKKKHNIFKNINIIHKNILSLKIKNTKNKQQNISPRIRKKI